MARRDDNVTHSTRKKKSCLMTFRLSEELIGELREEAENSQISLNVLANQVLNRYIAWERHSSKLGLIPFPRPFVREIFRGLADERIKEIACNSCKESLKELVLIKEGNLNLDSFITVFNEWLRASWMIHRYRKNLEGHHYVIHHDLNKTFSVYLEALLRSIIDDLQNCKGEITVRQNSLSIDVAPVP